MRAYFCTLIAVLASALSLGCASYPRAPLADEARDTTGSFDGDWVARVARPARLQPMPGKWMMECNAKAFDFGFTVTDGRLTIGDNDESAVVDESGRFAWHQYTGAELRVSGPGPAIRRDSQQMRIALQGQLAGDEPSGRYTHGAKLHGWAGCSSPVEFQKRT